MIPNQEEYISLATQKRDGSFVNTPVWFAQEGERNSYFIFSNKKAGKIKRIRNFSEVKVAVCNYKGDLRGNWFPAKAELIDQPEKVNFAFSVIRSKYGWKIKIGDFFSKLSGRYYQRQIINFSFKKEH